jgi:chromosome segregation ATPase
MFLFCVFWKIERNKNKKESRIHRIEKQLRLDDYNHRIANAKNTISFFEKKKHDLVVKPSNPSSSPPKIIRKRRKSSFFALLNPQDQELITQKLSQKTKKQVEETTNTNNNDPELLLLTEKKKNLQNEIALLKDNENLLKEKISKLKYDVVRLENNKKQFLTFQNGSHLVNQAVFCFFCVSSTFLGNFFRIH